MHGCFWHRHSCRLGQKRPGRNLDYWLPKLERNVARDARNREALEVAGWDVLTVWECETKDAETLQSKLREFLGNCR